MQGTFSTQRVVGVWYLLSEELVEAETIGVVKRWHMDKQGMNCVGRGDSLIWHHLQH